MPSLDRFSHPLRYENDFTTRWYEPDVLTLEDIEQDVQETIEQLVRDGIEVNLSNVLSDMETPRERLTEAHRRHIQDLIDDALHEQKEKVEV